MNQHEYQHLVTSFRRILDYYAVDYRQSPPSYNHDTLYDHQCRLIIDEVGQSWARHYGYRPSAMLLHKALFAAEQSRKFRPPWHRRWWCFFRRLNGGR
ncbi:hypothetical protein [Oceanisphaera psychrotolerans]|uniref:Uncharacterized protein n=1 Tax=Oceanisphaera psychrotolerans TaxID=1414654 RepID=A0A1J4QC69_9GAMM|nr:hypothetical protein [Oceanisphaera psychrotolerans]OIN07680.1 hypothetical protein BFR47_03470 [Oceanisphaera psychrotolerans]